MKKYFTFLLLSVFCLSNCQLESNKDSTKTNQYNIIPIPSSLKAGEGQFVLEENTSIIVRDTNESVLEVARNFSQKVEEASGIKLSVKKEDSPKNAIIFQLDQQMSGDEAYSLSVNTERIQIKAKKPIGLFYAIQTLRQLLPKEFEQNKAATNMFWPIPSVEINDAPRFVYRGMHLDVSRHFFEVEAVKSFIDQLAFHKLNYFHWHLMDDQGWRIEIKQYPKLTEVGGFRNGTLVGHYNDQPHQFDGKRYGGFYTQDQIKEVVQYAADRFVSVIPEIELPGHAQAALAAYPELGCYGDVHEVMQKWGVSDNVYCPTEATFEFLENVIDEVLALFPGKYIHVGGDECPKTQWEESAFCQKLMKKNNLKDALELQSYFIQRIEKYINSKGRQIIGWDEILEGGLAPNATVMSWRGIEGGIEAAKAGHDVVMTPTSHMYFDYYQSDHPDEPLAIGGLIPLQKVYEYEPIPDELNEEEGKYVLGAQANVWTEYISTTDKLEYMTFPRLSALSEVVWSSKANRDFDSFISRLSPHLKRLEIMGINAANHLYDLTSSIQPQNGRVEVSLKALAKDAHIYYTTDGTEPTPQSHKYETPIQIDSSMSLRAQSFVGETITGRAWQQSFEMHKAAGKKIALNTRPHPKYKGGGDGSVINGVLGNSERYGDAEWLGFDGENFEAIIDFGQAEKLNEVSFRFFKGEGQWIYLPGAVKVLTSNDGLKFKEVAKTQNIAGDKKVVESTIALKDINSRYLKIVAENYGVIPKGRQGAGNKSWMFIDEVRVN